MLEYLAIASGLVATTYGHSELTCGDYNETPKQCAHGAMTASGEVFRPNEIPSAAIPLPRDMRLRVMETSIRLDDGPCVRIRINDKAHERWIGKRGLDLSPAAVYLLTGRHQTKHWSAKVYICTGGTT